MVSREELHRLVDSLPEGSLAPAEKMLTRFQTWPTASNLPPELELKRAGMLGRIEGFSGGVHFSPATRSGNSSRTHWDGDTLVVETRHYLRGRFLDVTQSIRLIEKKDLIYKHQVSGPSGKTDDHEIRFEIEA